MHKINLQMYSFTDGKHNDSRANLKIASELGYDGVELFGPNLEIPVDEMKVLLENLNLEPISLHAPETGKVEELIPYAKSLGMKFIGIGMEVMMNEQEVYNFADRLNEIGAVCCEKGLTLTYHNHTQEFAPCDGKRIIDVLMRQTDPAYVAFELDAGWCAAAGEDPIQLLKQYPGRVKLIHIKESDKVIGPQPPFDFGLLEKDEKGAPIFTDEMKEKMERDKQLNCKAGQGLVDWKKLMEEADKDGCMAYIVEREYSAGDRVEELKSDIKYYRTLE